MEKRDRTHAIMRLQIKGKTVTSLKRHAGRPDLDVERDDLSRRERLYLIMTMVWTIRQGCLRVKLAMRCSQPAFGNRSRFTNSTDCPREPAAICAARTILDSPRYCRASAGQTLPSFQPTATEPGYDAHQE
jgi:hypothetical protein